MQANNSFTPKLTFGQTLNPHLWVSAHADYLYTYAITRINDADLAKDLVQETFLAALEKTENFEGRSSERTWLTAILKNKVIDVYRKRSTGINKAKNVAIAEKQQHDFFEQGDGHWSPEHRPAEFIAQTADPLHDKEFAKVLALCTQKLPALWLSVFSMKLMDDEETDKICFELKLTPANFWVIIHRTKLNLRACLQKNWI